MCALQKASGVKSDQMTDTSMSKHILIGGTAASCAAFFTNPLEVAKTRMQLQGELVARGHYAVHYRNVFHAFYQIARVDGLLALQKGLVPAECYQFVATGIRLGIYQQLTDNGFTKDSGGHLSLWRSCGCAAASGILGVSVGSPLYMIKIHLQSRANVAIAVGHQHRHDNGMREALRAIHGQYGIRGLWRGMTSAWARVAVGSAAQLTTYTWAKEHMSRYQLFPADSWLSALPASILGGITAVLCQTPFDVVSTRMYNQGVDSNGRGLLYRGIVDCFVRMYKAEGIWGFYKGLGASMFRLGPHTVLTLVFWHQIQVGYKRFSERKVDGVAFKH